MALQNTFAFTKTIIDINNFLKNTGNQFRYVSQRPYQSKQDPAKRGVSVTLLVIQDSTDYGEDKNGRKRETNTFNSFDVTILNGESYLDLKKGDVVSLIGFIEENSFAIGFDLILRFKNIKKLDNDGK